MKREFLQLAKDYDPNKHYIQGMYYSEKLDGQRALWDGGISRGILANQIPYANITKHGRFIDPTYATGLWSRYGQTIQAPDWFLDQLPIGQCLDGELYLGKQQFQDQGFIRARVPDSDSWRRVKFQVFDSPTYSLVFQDGEISNPNFKKSFQGLFEFIRDAAVRLKFELRLDSLDFSSTLEKFDSLNDSNVLWLPQKRLPNDALQAHELIHIELDRITDSGGEGLILRAPYSIWTPKRTQNLLKVKKLIDSEGTVIGFRAGKGKFLGMMGCLIIKWNGKHFDLSGFTNEERVTSDTQWCTKNPGEAAPSHIQATHFHTGSSVTFRYRELTQDGIPREARFWRTHD